MIILDSNFQVQKVKFFHQTLLRLKTQSQNQLLGEKAQLLKLIKRNFHLKEMDILQRGVQVEI